MEDLERSLTGEEYTRVMNKLKNFEPGTQEYKDMLNSAKILGDLILEDDKQKLECDKQASQAGVESEKIDLERDKLAITSRASQIQTALENGLRGLTVGVDLVKTFAWIGANTRWANTTWFYESNGFKNASGIHKDQMLKPPM